MKALTLISILFISFSVTAGSNNQNQFVDWKTIPNQNNVKTQSDSISVSDNQKNQSGLFEGHQFVDWKTASDYK